MFLKYQFSVHSFRVVLLYKLRVTLGLCDTLNYYAFLVPSVCSSFQSYARRIGILSLTQSDH